MDYNRIFHTDTDGNEQDYSIKEVSRLSVELKHAMNAGPMPLHIEQEGSF
jgi:hypothetical protein